MDEIYENFSVINNQLILEVAEEKETGLLRGKMGISIYFFHLARATQNKRYQQFAESMVDEVYDKVKENSLPSNFGNGLAGVAWGIEYLVKNKFVEADTDAVLNAVDNKIYRHIINQKTFSGGLRRGLLGYILYLISRLEGKSRQKQESSSTLIFKKLLINLINHFGNTVEKKKIRLQEPILFDTSWELPLCLIVLANVIKLHIYDEKVSRILDFLSPVVLSLYPRSPSNRLYLLLGLESILKQTNMPSWKEHAQLLKNHIELEKILDDDLQNKNIELINGLSGISLISRHISSLLHNKRFLFNSDELIHRILGSEYWEMIEKNSSKKNLGLLSGLAGINMELLKLLDNVSLESKNI